MADERTRLELAIAEQQRRRDSADRLLERLDTVGAVPSPGLTDDGGTPSGWANGRTRTDRGDDRHPPGPTDTPGASDVTPSVPVGPDA